MSCNSCAKGFSLLRPEVNKDSKKGCPNCGFSFCSKCLNNKVFVPKLNSDAKVCAKCKKLLEQKDNVNTTVAPPDAYYKRLTAVEEKSIDAPSSSTSTNPGSSIEHQIQERLAKLKENNVAKLSSEEEIAQRLQAIKGVQSVTNDDISSRLAKLRGAPVILNKPVLPAPDLRTEQEQADDLMKQYLEQTQLDTKYKDEFDTLINDMESRMLKLKGSSADTGAGPSLSTRKETDGPSHEESEDEEESVRKIVEKIKTEASLEINEIAPPTHDELPFCEICNEDATMRCLGCRYLFCKRCFRDHQDDDDGCNRYEPYKAPKNSQY